MTPDETIRALLTAAAQAAADEEQSAARKAARAIWASQAVAAFFAAQERVGEAWDRILDTLPDDIDDEELEKLPEPPEQAEADALWAEIEAVRDHDRWPRHLYWGDV
ncbi:MAG TPA: hypothetical protein VGR19_04955 [Allosphingosinicella sp.]|nr:hypothetical protein [Allosphingosinicella sp.]